MSDFDSNLLSDYTSGLCLRAAGRGHRAVLVLSGDSAWCRAQAVASLAGIAEGAVWVGEHAPEGSDVLPWSHAHTRLGMEIGSLVIDAFDGFDADGFGALSGTVRAGGLLLLLVPELGGWQDYADPQQQRFTLYPYSAAEVSGHFLHRLALVLQQEPGISVLRQGQPLTSLPEADATFRDSVSDGVYATGDQRNAVDAIRRLAQGGHSKPLVLSADRGRGKSAALGIAAAQLLHQGEEQVIVTAPRIDAAAQVFEHAARQLPDGEVRRGELLWQGRALRFVPPDALMRVPHSDCLLLVDEAAAIPTPILERLLRYHSRVIFATTIHGYEGTGRGFAVRFRRVLDEQRPGWQEMHLSQPVRWAEDDPLERLSFRALLLDAEAVDECLVSDADVTGCVVEQLDPAALVDDERSLSELFGLLVLAHYRTSPNDLRQLLDGPQQRLFVLRYDGHVVATALVVLEGGLDAALSEEVYLGRRRVQGHLLPQSLANHAGFPEAAQLSAARVMRIAVHPALQGRGLGGRLLQEVERAASNLGCDYFGASFGATGSLLDFWLGQGLLPVRVGLSREASSGTHSVMVMKPLSETGAALFHAIRLRLAESLPLLLAEPLSELEPALVDRLVGSSPPVVQESISEQDRRDLFSFAFGLRGYELCMLAVGKLILQVMAQEHRWSQLDSMQQQLLLEKVVQRHDWPRVVRAHGLSGRKQALAVMREAVALLVRSEFGEPG